MYSELDKYSYFYPQKSDELLNISYGNRLEKLGVTVLMTFVWRSTIIWPDTSVLYLCVLLNYHLNPFSLMQQVSHVREQEVLNQQAYMLFYVRDRKGIVPRKPVDIVKKENMKVNVNGNGNSTASNQVLKEVPNGLVENKSCGESSLTAETQKNMSNVDSSRVSFTKDGQVQQKSCPSLAESLMQNKKPVSEPSSKEQQQKESREGPSVASSELECSLSLDHSRKEYCLPNSMKSLVASAGDNIDKNGISKVVEKKSLSSAPAFNNPQTSVVHCTDGTSQSHKVNNFKYLECIKVVLF